MFSWAFLEPEEGVFRLEWLKEVIDRLYENEIVVMLSTPTAARPRWMAEKYPEVLRVNAARERNLYGERHNHCYTSPGKNENHQYEAGGNVQRPPWRDCMAYFE